MGLPGSQRVKKVQLQAVTGQIHIAVHKRKTGGKYMTAGQLRDQGSIVKVDTA
jgi:hypothetical protein